MHMLIVYTDFSVLIQVYYGGVDLIYSVWMV